MMAYYGIVALMGYLFGCSNLAFFLGKAKGFDIRKHGSNNAGASNATVTMGLKAGVLVGVHDVGKSCIVALLAAFLFPALPGASAVAGSAAVIGHIFPFYLNFRGGKGFASFVGMILALDWKFFLVIVLAALLITLISDYIAVATLTTATAFPIYLIVTHGGIIIICAVCVASFVIFTKHAVNIKRICSGEEIGLRRTLRKTDRVK